MAIPVVEIQNYKEGFWLTINFSQMKSLNFENWSSQKLGIIFENKMILKLMLSDNVNNKRCAPKLVFFNEKEIRKDSDDF